MHGFILPAVSKLTVLALAVQTSYIDPVRVTVRQTEELTQTLDKRRIALRPVLVRQNTFLVFCLQAFIYTFIYTHKYRYEMKKHEADSNQSETPSRYGIREYAVLYLSRSNIDDTYFMSLVGMNVVQHLQSSSGGLQKYCMLFY